MYTPTGAIFDRTLENDEKEDIDSEELFRKLDSFRYRSFRILFFKNPSRTSQLWR